MKKFFMITPLQPRKPFDQLEYTKYEAVGNSKLEFHETRFPIMAVINGYAEKGEEIRLIAVTPETENTPYRIEQLKAELKALQEEKGFLCPYGEDGVDVVSLTYAGDVATQIELFHKLLPYIEDNDILYGCLTYGDKPMPIAELMAIQYGYRVLNNVSIGCLVYGEKDHSKIIGNKLDKNGKVITNKAGEPILDYASRIFDITALIRLDEIVRLLADNRVKNPLKVIEHILDL